MEQLLPSSVKEKSLSFCLDMLLRCHAETHYKAAHYWCTIINDRLELFVYPASNVFYIPMNGSTFEDLQKACYQNALKHQTTVEAVSPDDPRTLKVAQYYNSI